MHNPFVASATANTIKRNEQYTPKTYCNLWTR